MGGVQIFFLFLNHISLFRCSTASHTSIDLDMRKDSSR